MSLRVNYRSIKDPMESTVVVAKEEGTREDEVRKQQQQEENDEEEKVGEQVKEGGCAGAERNGG